MIINVESNKNGYLDLFRKSYKLIHADAGPDDRFSSIEEFFANFGDIVDLDRNYLIRLPIEEPVLAIDANKRTIDTTLFSKCTNVQSDQMAEILVFSIDRYFDYKDLADPQMQFWVQWTVVDDKGNLIEKATEITLKDTETEPGKIRFGWPLSNVITMHTGKIQFAVRIFEKADVVEFDQLGNEITVNKVVYSFNTLPAALTIQKALQPELNDDTAINRPNGLFHHIVRNSQYAGKDVLLPQTPSFDTPGLPLPPDASLVNNTLTLMAQAVTGDTSFIDYTWYHVPVGATSAIECGKDFGTVGIAYRQSRSVQKVASDNYYSAESLTIDNENRKDIYYSAIENENMPAFIQYMGAVSTIKLEDGTVVMVDENGLPLYEKYTTFTVPAEGEVTGKYYVRATATKRINDVDYTGGIRDSECILVSPSDINVITELPSFAVLQDGDPASVLLSFELVQNENDNTVFTYTWQKYDNKEDTLPENVGNNNTITVTDKGWYKIYVTANLNRQTNEYISDWCKVTEPPTEPILTLGASATAGISDGNLHIIAGEAGDTVTLSVDAAVTGATSYNEDDLYSEGLAYSWSVNTADNNNKPLELADIVGGAIDGPSINVLVKDNTYIYVCTVTNTLNQEKAQSTFAFEVR